MPTLTAESPHAWNWQVWETFPKADSVWVGFFGSEKDAFAWCKSQAPRTFVVNNVPPVRSTVPLRPVNWQDQTGTRTKRRPVTEPVRAKSTVKKVSKPKPAIETSEVKALKADAAKVLKKHQADEAADLAAEKTSI